MEKRLLGTLEVSAIGLGCMGLSANYGDPVDTAHGIDLIRGAHDQGVTFFDTAEAYGPLTNEILVGQALEPIREEVVVATKFGFEFDPRRPNSRPDHIRTVVDQMLQRLRTDRIDLLYQHRVDPDVPIETSPARSGPDCRGQGRPFRAVGGQPGHDPPCPCCPARRCRAERVLHLGPRPRGQVLPACAELGVGFVPWSPLGQGFLTGSVGRDQSFAANDIRSRFPRFTAEALKANQPIVDLVKEIAERKGASRGQIALAWLLAKSQTIVPIPGSRKSARVAENIHAADVTLTAGEVAEIRAPNSSTRSWPSPPPTSPR